MGNIPYGVTYTVAEDDYSTNGYTTTMSGNSGEVSKAEQTAAFTNDKNSDNIDTGINLTTLPYILVFAGVIVSQVQHSSPEDVNTKTNDHLGSREEAV